MGEPQPTASRDATRSSPMGWLVILLIVAAIGLAIYLRGGASPVGKKLPALELTTLTGQAQVVTLDELTGRVVLVNFFATWCGPCQVELPHLARLRERFASNPYFLLLPVSCGEEDPIALRRNTRELLSRLVLDLPTYADPEGTTRDAFRQVGRFEGFPTSFVLDRQGVVRQVWAGYALGVEDEMQATIEQLLAEQ